MYHKTEKMNHERYQALRCWSYILILRSKYYSSHLTQ